MSLFFFEILYRKRYIEINISLETHCMISTVYILGKCYILAYKI